MPFRYWKISLLVHPDKCSHPQAHQAFIKLNKAFKELQDPEKVSLVDGWFIIEVIGSFYAICLQLFIFKTYPWLIVLPIYGIFFCLFILLVDCFISYE